MNHKGSFSMPKQRKSSNDDEKLFLISTPDVEMSRKETPMFSPTKIDKQAIASTKNIDYDKLISELPPPSHPVIQEDEEEHTPEKPPAPEKRKGNFPDKFLYSI